MITPQVSNLLRDEFRMLVEYLEGLKIGQVLSFTEHSLALLLENNLVVMFSNLEDELLVDLVKLLDLFRRCGYEKANFTDLIINAVYHQRL